MAFFRKQILDKERIKALENFRDRASKTLKQLEKKAKSDVEKALYASMRKNVVSTPIYFYPKKSLKEKIMFKGGRVYASVVKGENVSNTAAEAIINLSGDELNQPSWGMTI